MMENQIIQNKIYEIRGFKVMLDYDLAELYQVETKVLNQSAKRNSKRFPPDFMFQLTNKELNNLMRSQIVTASDQKKRNENYLPYAFTEQGIAMLSGILKSDIAIEINISIMRTFIALRQYALGYSELKQQLDNFMVDTNLQFNEIYQALTEMVEQKELENKPRNPIGYR